MNNLQRESSPYLLQHAHNPVDWYAWRPEAFERARAEQKPILVSIGYSTCHWCHVMERESFENEDIAAFMNENFVNIKVDREERPDVDAIYMEACQILTGGGGWPLNCFLTPDGRPFYAGTYFPPRPAFNRPSWLQLLQHLANIWETKRDVALGQAEKLMAHISRNDDVFVRPPQPPRGGEKGTAQRLADGKTDDSKPSPLGEESDALPPVGRLGGANPETLKPSNLETMYYQMRERFDRVEGGFGGAPKFPSTMAIQYLLNYHWFTGNPEALEHAQLSLDKMIHGGIYDQIGGGFARYATDREWLVPHFEKMLYDNALLVTVLSEAYKLTRKEIYKETIEETLGYVRREMTSPDGVFYSAQDADSEGVEGKFYVWGKAEIEEILGDEAPMFCAFYGVTEHGNWEEKNILWRPSTFEDFAAANKIEVAGLKKRLFASREKLFAVRSKRVWPGLDNKVLLSWNALMASAYAAAFTALGHEEYRATAVRNVDFLLENFAVSSFAANKRSDDLEPSDRKARTSSDDSKSSDEYNLLAHGGTGGDRGGLKHSASQSYAFLEDYAFFIAALTDVYQITFDARYLHLAGKYTGYVLSHFFDSETGLFFFTDANQSDIILRKKDLYDNATPSGNSTMALNLQRLGILLDRRDWRETASRMLLTMRETVERYPLSFERWAAAMMNEAHPLHEIAVVGDNAEKKAIEIQRGFLPNKVVAASKTPTDEMPLLAGKPGSEDAQIYVCRDFACQRPVVAVGEFWGMVAPNFSF